MLLTEDERESSMMTPRGLSAQPIKGYGEHAVSSGLPWFSIDGWSPPYFGIQTRFLQRSTHMFRSQLLNATTHEASTRSCAGMMPHPSSSVSHT